MATHRAPTTVCSSETPYRKDTTCQREPLLRGCSPTGERSASRTCSTPSETSSTIVMGTWFPMRSENLSGSNENLVLDEPGESGLINETAVLARPGPGQHVRGFRCPYENHHKTKTLTGTPHLNWPVVVHKCRVPRSAPARRHHQRVHRSLL